MNIEPLAIPKIQSKSFPELLFEYHPGERKVFVINTSKVERQEDQEFHRGLMIAQDVESIMHFKSIVTGFVIGYKTGLEQPRSLDRTSRSLIK